MRIQDILAHCDVSIRYSVPDIEPNATHTILTRRTKNHIQLNVIDCMNYSNSDIELRLNPKDNIFIPSRISISIHDRIVSELGIKNLSRDNIIRNGEILLSFNRWIQ